jgi:uncharacterized membrane protein YvbJ
MRRLVTNKFNYKSMKPILVLIVISSIFLVSSQLVVSNESTFDQFEKGILNNDISLLKPLLVSQHPELEISDENVQQLLAYLNIYKEEKKSLLKAISAKQDHPLIAIKNEKKWYFFDQYVFAVKPFFIHFQKDKFATNIEFENGSKVEMISETMAKSGPLMPGSYYITVTYQSDYTSPYKKKKKLNVSTNMSRDKTNIIPYEVKTNVVRVSFHDSLEGYTLFINGQKTDTRLKGHYTELKSLPTDGTVSVAIGKEYPWGYLKSEEREIKFSRVALELNLENEQVIKEIKDDVRTFLTSYKQAWQSNDFSIIKNVTDDVRKKLEGKVLTLKNTGYKDFLEEDTIHLGLNHPDVLTSVYKIHRDWAERKNIVSKDDHSDYYGVELIFFEEYYMTTNGFKERKLYFYQLWYDYDTNLWRIYSIYES